MDRKIDLEYSTRIKLYWRIIPFVFVLYIIAFLDRVNIGYAALAMNKDLGFSNTVFGMGAGIFFFGYFLMEVPGNIIMERWSARLWISRILVTWGIISGCMAFVTSETEFYAVRFLLGVAEASFMPGIIYYLSCWFWAKEQARAVALFMVALPVCNMIGSPLSTHLLDINWLNFTGWQWLFFLEAAPAIIFGIITPFYLTDRPHRAKWLEPAEKDWLLAKLAAETARKKGRKAFTLMQAFADRDVLILAATYFFWICGFYGFTMWLPTIVKSLSATLTNIIVGYLAAIPYVGALLSMILISRHSDQTGERRYHTFAALIAGGVCLGLSVLFSHAVGWSIFFFTLAAMGIYGAFGPFWAIPSSFLSEVAAAGSIALINSIGNLGGFVGPYIMGYTKDVTGSFYGGVMFLVGCLIIGGMLPLLLRKT